MIKVTLLDFSLQNAFRSSFATTFLHRLLLLTLSITFLHQISSNFVPFDLAKTNFSFERVVDFEVFGFLSSNCSLEPSSAPISLHFGTFGGPFGRLLASLAVSCGPSAGVFSLCCVLWSHFRDALGPRKRPRGPKEAARAPPSPPKRPILGSF